MFFKKNLNLPVLSSIFLLIAIVTTYVNDDLQRFIHPRYILFTVIFTVLGIMLMVPSKMSSSKVSISDVCTLLIAVCALILPAKSLSGELAANRNNALQTQPAPISTSYDSFSQDLSRFTISEWSALLSGSPDKHAVVGKKANIQGFLYQKDDQWYVARYRLTCCAVDATPLTVPLKSIPTDTFKQNNWVDVSGVMIENNIEPKYVLSIEKIELISEPKDAYVY